MWISELTMKTMTADNTMGSQSTVRAVMNASFNPRGNDFRGCAHQDTRSLSHPLRVKRQSRNLSPLSPRERVAVARGAILGKIFFILHSNSAF
jgi:hypothetical protein